MHSVVKLGEIVDITSGLPLRDGVVYAPDGNARLVQMKDLHPVHGLSVAGLHTIHASKVNPAQWLKPDDVLFIAKGVRYFAAVIPTVPDQTAASPHLFILRAKRAGQYIPEYLAWCLNNDASQRYFNTNAAGTTAQYVRKEVLLNLEIALPPLEVQQRIVQIAAMAQRQEELTHQLLVEKKRYINTALTQLAQRLKA